MNGDTPGAVPSDDFPFLGPAISPRRREAAEPVQNAGELTGPFVGGMFGSTPGEQPVEDIRDVPEASLQESPVTPADEQGLEDLPETDWPSDDFPWLIPSEREPDSVQEAEPWRATAEVEQAGQLEEPVSGPDEADMQGFGWMEEPLPELSEAPRADGDLDRPGAAPAADAAEGDESFAWEADDDYESFAWETEPPAASETADVGVYAPEAGEDERLGFSVDSESAEESWPGAESWSAEGAEPAAAGDLSGADEAVEEASVSPPEHAWQSPGEGEGEAEEDRWTSAAGFEVDDEGNEGPEVERSEPVAEAEAVVDAPPLPIGEWEAAPEDTVAQPTSGDEESDALVEVADRLERIARSLRSGKPVEAFEEGDPLQLLITGYALGYSQARKGNR